MFGNQNIHFWEGLFSKCFFFTSCSCFWIFGILVFFFFFFKFCSHLGFYWCKKCDRGKKEGRGPGSFFFMWIDFFSLLFCPVLQQSAVVRFNSVQVSRIPVPRLIGRFFCFFRVVQPCEDDCLFSTFVFSGMSMGCYHRENKGRFRRTHYPRLNRNSSAHPDSVWRRLSTKRRRRLRSCEQRQRRLRSVSGFSLALPVRCSKQVNFRRMERRGEYSTVQYSTVQYDVKNVTEEEGRGGEEGTRLGFLCGLWRQ